MGASSYDEKLELQRCLEESHQKTGEELAVLGEQALGLMGGVLRADYKELTAPRHNEETDRERRWSRLETSAGWVFGVFFGLAVVAALWQLWRLWS